MGCAYCGNQGNLTREHVFPNFLIDCFPGCDVNFGPEGNYIGQPQVVKDVCSNCNNGELSRLDNYGKILADRFLTKQLSAEENYILDYDYKLLERWLLKISYNCLRIDANSDIEPLKCNAKYILGEESAPVYYPTLYAGFFSNITPFPEGSLQDKKVLEFFPKPVLSENGILSDRYYRRELSSELRHSRASYLLRLGTGLFLIVLWKNDVRTEKIQKTEKWISNTFPYARLPRKASSAIIRRCVDPFNMFIPGVINSTQGQKQADKFYKFLTKNADPSVLKEYCSPENIKQREIIGRGINFPDNKKVQREFEALFAPGR